MNHRRIILIFSTIILLTAHISAQTGGNFTITQSVIASGGTQNAAGANFALDGTIGQAVAGNTARQSPFAITSGFFNFSASPTSAQVSVSGRVKTAQGLNLRGARVILTDSQGNSRISLTSAFGFYLFSDIRAGETVVLQVISKRYQFEPRVISINGQLTDVDFIALQ